MLRVKKTFFLFAVCFLSCVFYGDALFAENQLLFSADIIRHGDRTPTDDLPNAPYPWAEGLGQLTTKGLVEQYNLGRKMRDYYINQKKFLPPDFDSKTIYVRSTDFERTKRSVESFLKGLYPNASIPVESVKREDDDLLLAKTKWGPWSFITLSYFKWRKGRAIVEHFKDRLPLWRKISGLKLDSIEDFSTLADNLFVRRLYNIPYPQGFLKKDVEEICSFDEKISLELFDREEVYGPTGEKLKVVLLDYMKKAKEGKTSLKYLLFSGHDATLMALLGALRLRINKWPSYASRLNISLYKAQEIQKKEELFFIKVSLNGIEFSEKFSLVNFYVIP